MKNIYKNSEKHVKYNHNKQSTYADRKNIKA